MIYELDRREIKNDHRPIVLFMENDCLLYWRSGANGEASMKRNKSYWLRLGWYQGDRSGKITEQQQELIKEGQWLRSNWRRVSKESARKQLPESQNNSTFWFGGQSFRFENFPHGAADVRRAVKLLRERNMPEREISRRYKLSPGSGGGKQTLRRAERAVESEKGERANAKK